MIVFIYGTTAEAIKIAPVARRLEARGVAYQQWVTYQHTDALREIMPGLGLREPDVVIADGRNGQPLRNSIDVVPWLWSVRGWMSKNVRALRKALPKNTVIVVHGDTMTTVVGAYIAKRLRRPSAHIEAGLRSGNWRHPFPEELDRRIVGRMASIHYTPSDEATENLRSNENVVFTHGNTVIDAVLDHLSDEEEELGEYGVVLLHRFEFLGNRDLVQETMRVLAAESPYPLKFFVDEYAKETVADLLAGADRSKLQIQDKLKHEHFIGVLRAAQFIVTDSGGTQEESALLGLPTLIHRKATERREGMERNIVLSEWRIDVLSEFLRNFERYRYPPTRPAISPSDTIVDDLARRGFIAY